MTAFCRTSVNWAVPLFCLSLAVWSFGGRTCDRESISHAACPTVVPEQPTPVVSDVGVSSELEEDLQSSYDGKSGSSLHGTSAVLARCLITLTRGRPSAAERRLVAEVRQQLLEAQWDELEGIRRDDLRYGGFGGSSTAPPDLYHTALALEALHATGDADDLLAAQKALLFVTRCQWLSSDSGRAQATEESDDGGFVIAPMAKDRRKGCPLKTKPCGILACAGLQAYISAGMRPDDRRVKGALRWLGNHYALDRNPGATPPRQQLYEYYLGIASTMTALGVERIQDSKGVGHDWRGDLLQILVAQQESDGSWVNREESPDPEEATRLVTTSYAVMTLE